MASIAERLQVILELVAGQYKREAREAAKATRGISDEAGATGTAVGGLEGKMRRMSGVMKGAIIGGATAAGFAILKFGQDSLRAASDLEQSVGAVESVFGPLAERVRALGDNAAESLGLAESEYLQFAAVTGAQLRNLGVDQDEVIGKTDELIRLGADLAATYGGTTAEAVQALSSLLRGERDPVERYAVSIKQSDINARLAAEGLGDLEGEARRAAETQATLALLSEQTAEAQGQFAREADTAAVSQQRLNAKLEDAKAEIGQALLPILVELIETGEDLIPVITEIGQAAAGIAENWGPAITVISDLVGAVDELPDVLPEWLTNPPPIFGQSGTQAGQVLRVLPVVGEWFEARAAILEAEEALEEAEKTANLTWAAMDQTRRATRGAGGAMREAAEDAEALDEATDDAAGEVKTLGQRAKETADYIERAAEAQRGYTQALLEAANPVFAASAAAGRYQDALDNLQSTQEGSEASARDLAEAELAVAEAKLELQAALDALDASGAEAGIDAIATALGKSREETILLLEQLGILDGTEVTAVVTTSFRAVGDRSSLSEAAKRGFRVPGGIQTGRAQGGPMEPGKLYQVGENDKPELMVIPGNRGQMFSNADVRSLISAFSGGGRGGASITINYPQHTGDDIMHGVRTATMLDGLAQYAETAPGVA